MEAQIKNPLHHWSFPYHIRAYRETGIDKILRDAPNLILAMAPKEIKNGRENTIFSFALAASYYFYRLYKKTIKLIINKKNTSWIK